MSKALRGDFERLRERGVASTLSPGGDDAPAEVNDSAVTVEQPVEEVYEPPPLRDEPEARPEPEESDVPEEPPDDVAASKPGLFGRLLGR